MFDIGEARTALQLQRRELQAECEANSKLQRRFDSISAQLRSSTVAPATTDQTSPDEDSTDLDGDDSRGDLDPSSDAWTDSITSSQSQSHSREQSADQLDAMELLDQLGASLQATDTSSSSDGSSGSGKGNNARGGNNNRRK